MTIDDKTTLKDLFDGIKNEYNYEKIFNLAVIEIPNHIQAKQLRGMEHISSKAAYIGECARRGVPVDIIRDEIQLLEEAYGELNI